MTKQHARHKDLRENGRIILAWGEVTNHHHEVLTEAGAVPGIGLAQFFEVDGQRELVLLGPCVLTHQEHGRIALDPARPVQVRQGDVLLSPLGDGVWRVTQQQEQYQPNEWRSVAD